MHIEIGNQMEVKLIFYYLGFWHQARIWNSINLNYWTTALSL